MEFKTTYSSPLGILTLESDGIALTGLDLKIRLLEHEGIRYK